MRISPVALHVLIASAALATSGGGILAASDLRADERRERALEAQRRAEARELQAVQAYRQTLTPVAEAVFDVVQPLQQAFADLDDGDVDAVDVLIDVSVHLVGEQGVAVLDTRLAALTPAGSVQEEHELLRTALKDMTAAARVIATLESSKEETVDADVIARGDLALDEATRDWTAPLITVYAGATSPPVPVEAGVDGRRPPLSHASYLREAGNLCSLGIDALDEAGSSKADPSLDEVRAGVRELGARVPKIVAVKAPPADAQQVTTRITTHLKRTVELVKGFDRGLAAAGRGDAAGVRDAQAQIARGEVAAEKAAAGFRSYGSQVCALYLVGLEEGATDGTTARPT